ncbi:FkbM family methyltransferase [Sphingorhabdus sp. YGSMI21]|uniref:FkbM family methyltransferase n=1 Tax=Sphingorhabdus sp. YGSMI21 TaxID=2077182 RepID=UPI000C1F4EA2|nr:FkbM family methyltransferase [Sphingorhabdus sp. YGSMI21]ATW03118.1 hypothetical protein CHN51_05845 [Sphingorhabdus sp. YGSMI21]
MPIQNENRYLEAAAIFAANPINAIRFGIDHLRGKHGNSYRLSFRGIPLLVRPTTTDLQVVRTCLLGEFDEVMGRVGNEHGLIVDAGGYIGLVSILLARQFPAAQIVCLEPSSQNFALAKENCRPYSNIEVWNCALAPQSGQLTLSDRRTGPWGYTVVADSADGEARAMETVEAKSVTNILDHFNVSGIDLLKLDIEGGELALLRDSPDWVKKTDVIVIELHDRIAPGATDAFREAAVGRIDIPIKGEKFMSIRPDSSAAAKVGAGK